jgi:tRNA modification GTPase
LPRSLIEGGRVLDVHNKADALTQGVGEAIGPSDAANTLCLSAKTGEGLDTLRSRLLELAGWHETPEGVYTARARHVQALRLTAEHLEEAKRRLDQTPAPLDLLAEELRLAQGALGDIVGHSTPDELLGEIFSRFCIGK